jgi:chaperone modulatory protein CbpM
MPTTLVRVTVQELCEQGGLSRSLLVELVQYDIAQPVAGTSVDDWVFDATAAHWLKKALRLQRDLDLDWVAVALLVDLLRERERLHQENQSLKQRLGRFLID